MLTGVVLAGGLSRRMGGSPKALLAIEGERLIDRQVRLMSPVCSEIVIVTGERDYFAGMFNESETVRLVKDVHRGAGPLAGIHAALSTARSEYAWVVGCDMPFLSADAAFYMWNKLRDSNMDAIVPSIDGRLQPLHAVYRKACADIALSLLTANTYRVMELLEHVRWSTVEEEQFANLGVDPRFTVNANTPEQWNEALVIAKNIKDR